MKKVLQVFPTLTRGGLETFVMNVYRCIDRTKFQFDFLVNRPEGDYKKEILGMGARIYTVPQAVNGWNKYTKALDNFFKEHEGEYCAVHLQASSLSNLMTLYYAKKYYVPVRIIHSHSSSVGQKGLMKCFHLLIHYISKPFVSIVATHYLGCSDKALDWLFKGTSIRRKSRIIKNGIDTQSYRFNPTIRKIIRNEYDLNNKFVIGHVGRFVDVKNHLFLLEILSELLKIRPNSMLMLIGDGPNKSKIEKKAGELGLMENIIFTGIRSDVNRLLQGIDIIVMPSLYEGLPMCLVEAQAAGLPLLLSDKISRQSKILEAVKFKSLEDSPMEWAKDAISLTTDSNRIDTAENISREGYDIRMTTQCLTEIYNNKSIK